VTNSSQVALQINVSVDEAAVALGVSPRMVRTLIAHRKLRFLRIGRRVLISVEALHAFVTAREQEARA
jgi:excisionase family DNA binding protein